MIFTERNIVGHEEVVARFKEGKGRVKDLPENYVIQDDSYFANYDTGDVEWSKLVEDVQEYIPPVGTLVRAKDIGRDEPHIFYKVLVKGSVTSGSSLSGIHDPHCKLLFVRSKEKQVYKKVHQIKMKVDREYYDRVQNICSGYKNPLLGHRLFLMAEVSVMPHYFRHKKSFYRTERMNARNYEARLRRKEALKNATPDWLTFEQVLTIRRIYVESKSRILRDGRNSWHVDHIVPLQGKDVCGLHVPWNLRIIPREDNLQKSNKMEEVG